MENVSQYTFELKELSEMLLKQKGIKEGLWDIGVNFKMAALLAGPARTADGCPPLRGRAPDVVPAVPGCRCRGI